MASTNLSQVAACFILTIFRTASVLIRLCYRFLEGVCNFADTVLQGYVTRQDAATQENRHIEQTISSHTIEKSRSKQHMGHSESTMIPTLGEKSEQYAVSLGRTKYKSKNMYQSTLEREDRSTSDPKSNSSRSLLVSGTDKVGTCNLRKARKKKLSYEFERESSEDKTCPRIHDVSNSLKNASAPFVAVAASNALSSSITSENDTEKVSHKDNSKIISGKSEFFFKAKPSEEESNNISPLKYMRNDTVEISESDITKRSANEIYHQKESKDETVLKFPEIENYVENPNEIVHKIDCSSETPYVIHMGKGFVVGEGSNEIPFKNALNKHLLKIPESLEEMSKEVARKDILIQSSDNIITREHRSNETPHNLQGSSDAPHKSCVGLESSRKRPLQAACGSQVNIPSDACQKKSTKTNEISNEGVPPTSYFAKHALSNKDINELKCMVNDLNLLHGSVLEEELADSDPYETNTNPERGNVSKLPYWEDQERDEDEENNILMEWVHTRRIDLRKHEFEPFCRDIHSCSSPESKSDSSPIKESKSGKQNRNRARKKAASSTKGTDNLRGDSKSPLQEAENLPGTSASNGWTRNTLPSYLEISDGGCVVTTKFQYDINTNVNQRATQYANRSDVIYPWEVNSLPCNSAIGGTSTGVIGITQLDNVNVSSQCETLRTYKGGQLENGMYVLQTNHLPSLKIEQEAAREHDADLLNMSGSRPNSTSELATTEMTNRTELKTFLDPTDEVSKSVEPIDRESKYVDLKELRIKHVKPGEPESNPEEPETVGLEGAVPEPVGLVSVAPDLVRLLGTVPEPVELSGAKNDDPSTSMEALAERIWSSKETLTSNEEFFKVYNYAVGLGKDLIVCHKAKDADDKSLVFVFEQPETHVQKAKPELATAVSIDVENPDKTSACSNATAEIKASDEDEKSEKDKVWKREKNKRKSRKGHRK